MEIKNKMYYEIFSEKIRNSELGLYDLNSEIGNINSILDFISQMFFYIDSENERIENLEKWIKSNESINSIYSDFIEIRENLENLKKI